jgi:hypothetical protein
MTLKYQRSRRMGCVDMFRIINQRGCYVGCLVLLDKEYISRGRGPLQTEEVVLRGFYLVSSEIVSISGSTLIDLDIEAAFDPAAPLRL